uniref:Protein spinster 1 n=1 Tax=Ascaris suum TaxID=6253 RepID=F1KX16_ASCSU
MEAIAEVEEPLTSPTNRRKLLYVAILLTVNLLNYMDRFTVAGVLTEIQAYFRIDDSQAGLLQTIFIVFYMLFAPVCGYLGDRFNRKLIMAAGLSVWVVAVFTSSLVPPKLQRFWLFLLCRGVVGVGEASYSTVAPTLIADMFVGHRRSTSLMIFYFAIPVGSGLGYMVGSYMSMWAGAWEWGVRMTPILGLICIVLILFVLDDPIRGNADVAFVESSSFIEDVRYLFKIPTYVLSTLGFTSVVFVTGCLAWWTPTLIEHAWAMHHGTSHVPDDVKAGISLVFGMITCFAGLLGVLVGSSLAQGWRDGFMCLKPNEHADPHVCALGALLGVPLLFLAIIFGANHEILCWIFILLGVSCCCLNWAVNMDMLMYIVVPNRRSTATAMQTLFSHLFGDASSPYLIGLISDSIRGDDFSTKSRFFALQSALFVPNFVLIGSGAFYLLASFSVVDDRAKAAMEMRSPESTAIVAVESSSDTSPLLDAVEQQPPY